MTPPHYADESVTLYAGDALDVLRGLPDNSVDSIVTDPPAGIAFMGKAWDGAKGGREQWSAWLAEIMAEALRVTKPGGHALVWALPRTAHWTACGLEDAGWEIRDRITHLFGSGFPKSLDVGKAIDRARGDGAAALAVTCWLRDELKRAGLSRADLMTRGPFSEGQIVHWLAGTSSVRPGVPTRGQWERLREVIGFGDDMDAEVWRLNGRKGTPGEAWAAREVVGTRKVIPGVAFTTTGPGELTVTAPATDAARRWDGWGTALKPAGEDWYYARKPLSPVPSWVPEARRLHHALGALLWLSLTPAKRAELTSPSSPHALPEATCVSALVAAALNTSPDASDTTATYNSPAAASTSSSIASSWNATLAALSDPTTTSTTATASSTTTALRTLNSLLAPLTSPTTIPACACLTAGPWLPAATAGDSSSDRWRSWLSTLTATAPVAAIEPISRAVASALADTAASLSGDSAAAGSSADGTATTAGAPHAEDWWLARKPLEGTVAGNVTRWGTGALNVDACRVEHAEPPGKPSTGMHGRRAGIMGETVERHRETTAANTAGRWPTNAVLDTAAAQQLDRETGVRRDGACPAGAASIYGTEQATRDRTTVGYGGEGGSSRFFPTFAPPGPLPAWRYEPKAPAFERPRVKEVTGPLLRLRDDLTEEQRAYVLEELAAAGLDVD